MVLISSVSLYINHEPQWGDSLLITIVSQAVAVASVSWLFSALFIWPFKAFVRLIYRRYDTYLFSANVTKLYFAIPAALATCFVIIAGFAMRKAVLFSYIFSLYLALSFIIYFILGRYNISLKEASKTIPEILI